MNAHHSTPSAVCCISSRHRFTNWNHVHACIIEGKTVISLNTRRYGRSRVPIIVFILLLVYCRPRSQLIRSIIAVRYIQILFPFLLSAMLTLRSVSDSNRGNNVDSSHSLWVLLSPNIIRIAGRGSIPARDEVPKFVRAMFTNFATIGTTVTLVDGELTNKAVIEY
jgi:hypothetical protein